MLSYCHVVEECVGEYPWVNISFYFPLYFYPIIIQTLLRDLKNPVLD